MIRRNKAHHIDILLVTVTEVEALAVLLEVENQLKEGHSQQKENHEKICHIGNNIGSIKGARIFMVQSEMGAGGPGGSTLTINEALRDLSPSAVIMLGIAFGIDETKQKIGDILVSRQLELYELQRVGTSSSGTLKIIRGSK